MLHSAVLNVMIKAAHRAGRSLKRDLGEIEHLQVSVKGPRNFVTAADRRAESILREELAKARLRLPRPAKHRSDEAKNRSRRGRRRGRFLVGRFCRLLQQPQQFAMHGFVAGDNVAFGQDGVAAVEIADKAASLAHQE